MLEEVEPVDRRQPRDDVQAGKEAECERPGDERRGQHGVEERVGQQGRAERGIGGALDAVLEQVELEHVAASGRDDRVHAHACHVGAVDVAPAHVRLRVRGLDDVAPGACACSGLQQVTEDAERERAPADRGEAVEERPRRVDDPFHDRSFPHACARLTGKVPTFGTAFVPKYTRYAAAIPGIHRRLAEPGGRLAGLDRRALPDPGRDLRAGGLRGPREPGRPPGPGRLIRPARPRRACGGSPRDARGAPSRPRARA